MQVSVNERDAVAVQNVATSPAAGRVSHGQGERLVLTGGRRLAGEIQVSGAKNAVLPILCTSLLNAEPLRLDNVPDLQDVRTMPALLGGCTRSARARPGRPAYQGPAGNGCRDQQARLRGTRRARLKGACIVTDMITVTGTENLLMAAVLAEGRDHPRNASREPEVTDLANLLVKMGARIDGIGTDRLC